MQELYQGFWLSLRSPSLASPMGLGDTNGTPAKRSPEITNPTMALSTNSHTSFPYPDLVPHMIPNHYLKPHDFLGATLRLGLAPGDQKPTPAERGLLSRIQFGVSQSLVLVVGDLHEDFLICEFSGRCDHL